MKLIFITGLIVLMGLAGMQAFFNDTDSFAADPAVQDMQDEPQAESELSQEEALSESFTLPIPFTSQAPFGNWADPFGSACEEASMLMVHYYFEGVTDLQPQLVAADIQDIVDFEMERYGFHKDTPARETAQLIRDYYGYQATVVYDISIEDIKRELHKGNAVILPTAGRLLGNPYFTPPGPLYHMVVVKGYTPTEVIVNDPGTRRGADFAYSNEVLAHAIRDWRTGDPTTERSAMIVVAP